ncbi:MAG: AMP-binding protein [Acidobacteriota bacterium]
MTAHRRRDPATVVGLLERAARDVPERGIAVLCSRGRGAERLTWPQVAERARRAAAAWAARGVAPGEPVAVVLPTSWDFLDAWLGAMVLGALPVASAPSAGLVPAEAPLRKLAGVVEHLGIRHIAAGGALRDAAAAHQDPALAALAARVTTPEALAASAVGAVGAEGPASPDDLAFLQLTSGSTGCPRAVEIRHRGAVHNAVAIDEAITAADAASPGGAHPLDGIVSWLPLHHDMGLVGCLLVAAAAGLDLWLLRPSTFLARPRLWLEHLGRHGEVFAHAPNFGYQLCVERLTPDERARLDLSPWRWAMTGAEMVREATARAFVEAFAPHGFRAEALRPCYGLAEATLAVTVDRAGRGLRLASPPCCGSGGAEDETSAVACLGPPVRDTRLRITAPDGRDLEAGAVGEVRVTGPGVFAGYRDDEAATAEALDGDELRTGDLGFVDARGELHLTGRIKELLILRGQNVMPHELEWVAERVMGGGGACRAGAFAIDAGAEGEQAVLALESRCVEPETAAALAADVRRCVQRELGIVPADVIVVRRGLLPRTTSGKLQRRALRDLYLRRALRPLSS